MGLDKKVLRTRTTTAVVFAVIMLLGLLVNKFLFAALCVVITIGCIYEFWKLAKKQQQYPLIIMGLLGTVFVFFSILCFFLSSINVSTVGSEFFLFKPVIPCCILFSIWINDTMAYIVGSLIGKTPLSKVSPKKTIEGTVGGALLAILIIGCLFQFLPFDQEHLIPIFRKGQFFNVGFGLIAAAAAVFGTLGDLAESKLKRIANVKDSGSFMPGHGGFLDRFDSLLLAGPACFWLLYLLSQLSLEV